MFSEWNNSPEFVAKIDREFTMSNEIIERVAKVIRIKYHGYDCGMDRCRADSIEQAKAAIEAMREPTEAMLDAGAYDLDMTLEQQWQRMIEAALKDG